MDMNGTKNHVRMGNTCIYSYGDQSGGNVGVDIGYVMRSNSQATQDNMIGFVFENKLNKLLSIQKLLRKLFNI